MGPIRRDLDRRAYGRGLPHAGPGPYPAAVGRLVLAAAGAASPGGLAAAGAEDSAANVHSGNAFLGMEVADGGPLA